MPVKLASPRIASFVLLGTPLVQFNALFQYVFVVPFQLVVCENASEEFNTNKISKVLNCSNLFIE